MPATQKTMMYSSVINSWWYFTYKGLLYNYQFTLLVNTNHSPCNLASTTLSCVRMDTRLKCSTSGRLAAATNFSFSHLHTSPFLYL